MPPFRSSCCPCLLPSCSSPLLPPAVWLINYRHFLSWKSLPGSSWIPDVTTFEFSVAKATFYFKVCVLWGPEALRRLVSENVERLPQNRVSASSAATS